MKSTNHPSRSLFVTLCFLWLLVAPVVGAQPDASVFFHQGAQHFLATNGMTQAKLAVTNGLKLYPNDEKLKKLWELLNQQQQSQDQNKDDKSEQQDQKDQQSKDQQKKNQEKKDQQQKSEEQKKQEQQKKEQEEAAKKDKQSEDEKKGQQSQPNQGKPEDQQEADGSPQGAKAMRMTPQQAMQLLEALKAEEKTMPFKPILKTNRQDRVFKDW